MQGPVAAATVVVNVGRGHDPTPQPQPPGVHGLAIAGFVCGVVGVVFFCIPLLGGSLAVLAVVFGGIGLAKGQPGRTGFAVAALSLGVIGCILSLIMLLAYADATRSRSRYSSASHLPAGASGALDVTMA